MYWDEWYASKLRLLATNTPQWPSDQNQWTQWLLTYWSLDGKMALWDEHKHGSLTPGVFVCLIAEIELKGYFQEWKSWPKIIFGKFTTEGNVASFLSNYSLVIINLIPTKGIMLAPFSLYLRHSFCSESYFFILKTPPNFQKTHFTSCLFLKWILHSH